MQSEAQYITFTIINHLLISDLHFIDPLSQCIINISKTNRILPTFIVTAKQVSNILNYLISTSVLPQSLKFGN